MSVHHAASVGHRAEPDRGHGVRAPAIEGPAGERFDLLGIGAGLVGARVGWNGPAASTSGLECCTPWITSGRTAPANAGAPSRPFRQEELR